MSLSFVPRRLRLITPLILAIFWVNSVYAESSVILQTPLGDVHLELFDDSTPQTVTNFLNYVRDGDYEKSFIHRSIPGFVIQGGGYTFLDDTVHDIPSDPPVVNEPGHSNVRGTIAMAKLGGDPAWTAIQMTPFAADATDAHKCCCAESYTVGTEKDHFKHIGSGTHTAVNPKFNRIPQTGFKQGAMCFTDTYFCRQTDKTLGMLAGGPGAALVTT